MELRSVHADYANKGNRSSPERLKAGDVVVIGDSARPRGQRKLGKVERVLDGADGQVQGAVVRTKSGAGPSAFIRRPVQLLYPLEVCQPVDDCTLTDLVAVGEGDCSLADNGDDSAELQQRPRRAAACAADRVRQRWIQEDLI